MSAEIKTRLKRTRLVRPAPRGVELDVEAGVPTWCLRLFAQTGSTMDQLTRMSGLSEAEVIAVLSGRAEEGEDEER